MAPADDDRQRRIADYRRHGAPRTENFGIANILKRLQDDTAASADVDEMPEDLGPAYLRGRAAHYRALADPQTNAARAKIFCDLLAIFDKHAGIKEQGASRKQSQPSLPTKQLA